MTALDELSFPPVDISVPLADPVGPRLVPQLVPGLDDVEWAGDVDPPAAASADGMVTGAVTALSLIHI